MEKVKACVFLIAWLFSSSVVADPMQFAVNETGGNHCCTWVQATGDITPNSATTFEAFFKHTEFVPHVVRLNSPGGDLFGGILLGETFRRLGVSTEVGSSSFDPKFKEYSQEPGACASACAYAFLGGVERSLEAGAKLGFHRFYASTALTSSTTKILSGEVLDDTQKVAAALLLYLVDMGIDARLLILASQAGPNEIWWVSPQDAQDLRVTYDPNGYKSWQIEPYQGGAIAVSQSNDGLRSVVAACSRQGGPYVAIIDSSPNADQQWLDQCRVMGAGAGGWPGINPVFGAAVPASNVSLATRSGGGTIMKFQLPSNDPPLTSPKLFTWETGYPLACSTNRYSASSENFAPSVRLAMRNCY